MQNSAATPDNTCSYCYSGLSPVHHSTDWFKSEWLNKLNLTPLQQVVADVLTPRHEQSDSQHFTEVFDGRSWSWDTDRNHENNHLRLLEIMWIDKITNDNQSALQKEWTGLADDEIQRRVLEGLVKKCEYRLAKIATDWADYKPTTTNEIQYKVSITDVLDAFWISKDAHPTVNELLSKLPY